MQRVDFARTLLLVRNYYEQKQCCRSGKWSCLPNIVKTTSRHKYTAKTHFIFSVFSRIRSCLLAKHVSTIHIDLVTSYWLHIHAIVSKIIQTFFYVVCIHFISLMYFEVRKYCKRSIKDLLVEMQIRLTGRKLYSVPHQSNAKLDCCQVTFSCLIFATGVIRVLVNIQCYRCTISYYLTQGFPPGTHVPWGHMYPEDTYWNIEDAFCTVIYSREFLPTRLKLQ